VARLLSNPLTPAILTLIKTQGAVLWWNENMEGNVARDVNMRCEEIKIIGMDESRSKRNNDVPDRFDVAFRLSAVPSQDWEKIFIGLLQTQSFDLKCPAWVYKDEVILTCQLNEVKPHHLPRLTRAIDEANAVQKRQISVHLAEIQHQEDLKRQDARALSDLKHSLEISGDV
jgi:hypothetical protein